MIYKNAKRRHEVLFLVIHMIKNEAIFKLFFSISVIKYNSYIKESDENVQQQSYYLPHRPDSQY